MHIRLLFPSILTFYPRAFNAHYVHGGRRRDFTRRRGSAEGAGGGGVNYEIREWREWGKGKSREEGLPEIARRYNLQLIGGFTPGDR